MELKNTLKVIGISLLGVLGVGMSCYSHSVGMTLLAPNYEKASAYYVEPYSDSVTFSADELNNISYSYLASKLNLLTDNPFTNSYIKIGNDTFNYYSLSNNIITWEYNESYITFDYDDSSTPQYCRFAADDDYENWAGSITLYSSWFANNMAKSVTLTASELNNNIYEYFVDYMVYDSDYDNELTNSYIIYNNAVYIFSIDDSDVPSGDLYYFDSTQDNYIYFGAREKWEYTYDGQTILWTNSITIYSTYIADNLYAPNQPVNLLTAIVGLLTGGITGIASGVGSGVSTLTSQIFIVDNALSVFGGILVVFAGISLAIGLSRWIMNFLTSLGAKK